MARTATQDEGKPLTDKQRRFVREYLLDFNATQAAIRAGYKPETARMQGSRLVTNDDVLDAIDAGRRRTEIQLDLTRDQVMRQYQRLGFSDPRKLFHPDGRLKAIPDLDDDTAAALQGFEVETRSGGEGEPPITVTKVRWADRRPALDSIMKAQAWNKTDIGNDDNPLTGLLKALGGASAALPVQPIPIEDDDD